MQQKVPGSFALLQYRISPMLACFGHAFPQHVSFEGPGHVPGYVWQRFSSTLQGHCNPVQLPAVSALCYHQLRSHAILH